MVLDSAAERAGRELADQPDVRAEIERTIGDSYASLGEFALAGEHYDAAISAARKAGRRAGEIGLIAMRRALGINAAGKSPDALTAARVAWAQVSTLPEGDPERLKAESAFGTIERDAGKVEDARTRLARVVEDFAAAGLADTPEALDARRELAISEFVGGRYAQAQALLEPLIAEYAARYGDEDTHTIGARVTLAVLNNERENYAESARILMPLLPQVERVYGPEHPRTLVVVMNLGSAIRYQKRYDEARPYYERALALARKLYGPTAPRTLMAEGNMSLMLRDAGDLVASERHARFVADNAEAAFGDNPYRAGMYRGLATVLIRAGKHAEAERELQRAWTIFLQAPGYGEAHPRSQEVVDTFIELYDAWGKPARAAEWRARKTPATAASTD
jgi:non-specific serine/threonine protein kinase/serine/threonine-protein kinase